MFCVSRCGRSSSTYARDAQGNATSEASPDIGTRTTDHDALGLPSRIVDALGQATQIQRDLLGRPTSLGFADGKTTTLTYDAAPSDRGRLSRIEDASGSTAYTRDAFGRVTAKRQSLASGLVQQIAYGYTSAGQIERIPSGCFSGRGTPTSVTPQCSRWDTASESHGGLRPSLLAQTGLVVRRAQPTLIGTRCAAVVGVLKIARKGMKTSLTSRSQAARCKGWVEPCMRLKTRWRVVTRIGKSGVAACPPKNTLMAMQTRTVTSRRPQSQRAGTSFDALRRVALVRLSRQRQTDPRQLPLRP